MQVWQANPGCNPQPLQPAVAHRRGISSSLQGLQRLQVPRKQQLAAEAAGAAISAAESSKRCSEEVVRQQQHHSNLLQIWTAAANRSTRL
ncbi:hypothetical protein Acr_13g0003440 [Actinidia rufa]|uniref:Uncharacterized protein n=1 Tax=Actinidia rufa TaxID=165716 RepID=A0A7J0FK34_9ERIC|nr:hypothetical protein Acr_13g0003440 [Actinidia rufa]